MFHRIRTLFSLIMGLSSAAVCLTAHSAKAQSFTIPADSPVFSTGLLAGPNQHFTFKTTGSVNLAIFDSVGPGYITDANGAILTAPTPGGGSYEFFTGQPVHGVNPTVGGTKYIDNYDAQKAAKIGGAYGALYAGFAPSLTPTAYTDFTSGFTLIGKSGSVTAPTSGGYLFFSVNDIYGFSTRRDNSGSFRVTAVPEPGAIALFAGLGLSGAGLVARRQAKRRLK